MAWVRSSEQASKHQLCDSGTQALCLVSPSFNYQPRETFHTSPGLPLGVQTKRNKLQEACQGVSRQRWKELIAMLSNMHSNTVIC